MSMVSVCYNKCCEDFPSIPTWINDTTLKKKITQRIVLTYCCLSLTFTQQALDVSHYTEMKNVT